MDSAGGAASRPAPLSTVRTRPESRTEKDYCYGGFKPLQPSGPQLGRSQAGPYFAKAVKGTAAAYDAVRLAAVGGDKDAVNKSAAKARDLSQQAAETLAARTWPKSLTKQIRMVIIEYQERAAIYTNLAGNRNGEAIDWMVFGEFRPSGAQQVIRSALKLPDEPETAVPFDIRDIADGGAARDWRPPRTAVSRKSTGTVSPSP